MAALHPKVGDIDPGFADVVRNIPPRSEWRTARAHLLKYGEEHPPVTLLTAVRRR